MYVLASHGTYAEATLASCELIAGKLANFTSVSFHDPMSIDDLLSCQAALCKRIRPSQLHHYYDIPNGSPANAALAFKHQHPDIKFFGIVTRARPSTSNWNAYL